MLIKLKYLSNRVDNINDFSHQHLFKTEPLFKIKDLASDEK